MRQKSFLLVSRLCALAGVAMLAGGASAGDMDRGQALHDTFCVACHTPAVFQREDRLANTYLEIRQQVERWQGNARLRWSQQDIESVAEYLAGKYYKVAH